MWKSAGEGKQFHEFMSNQGAIAEWSQVKSLLEKGTGLLLVEIGPKGLTGRAWYVRDVPQGFLIDYPFIQTSDDLRQRISQLYPFDDSVDPANNWQIWAKNTIVPIALRTKMVRANFEEIDDLNSVTRQRAVLFIPYPCLATAPLERREASNQDNENRYNGSSKQGPITSS